MRICVFTLMTVSTQQMAIIKMNQGQCVELADYILKMHNAGNCILKTFYK